MDNVELDPQSIMKELQTFRHKLGTLNGEIVKLGNKKSEAERKYRVLRAQKIVILRDAKVPVTIITDLVKGDEEVAQLKLEFDALDVLYDNKRENIRSLRDVMSVYQSILNYLRIEITGG